MRELIRLLTFMRPYWGWMSLGMLLAFITVMANMALLALAGWFLTAMALAGAAQVGMNYFTPGALIRAAAIVRTVGRYAERLVTHAATFRLLAQLRVWLYERIEPIAPAGLERYHSGDVLSRLRADIDTLSHIYLRLIVPSGVALLTLLLLGIVLAQYDFQLMWVVLGLLAVAGVGVPWFIHRTMQTVGADAVKTRAALRSQLVDDVQGMGELLLYGAATQHQRQLIELNQLLIEQQNDLNYWSSFTPAALNTLAYWAMWAALWISIPLVAQQQMTSPEWVLLALLVLASFEAVQPLPLAAQTLGETLEAARRIFSLADSQPIIDEPIQPLSLPKQFTIQVQEVSFCYPDSTQVNLSPVSFNLAIGQTVALIGRSGVGKSTLLALLTRLRPLSHGTILLDGQPIQRYTSAQVRERMAVSSQSVQLFNVTIRDNLCLALQDASQAQLNEVCAVVLLQAFIEAQPAGYDTWIGETGIRLSGGQARRLSIARALLKPAPILILDEPTEGLDAKTAEQMMTNIVDWVRTRQQSLIIVTHQPYGLSSMDQRVLLK